MCSRRHGSFQEPLLDVYKRQGYTIGGMASFMSGAAMAVAIGYALQAPPLVLFSLATVGYACNVMGKAGGPLAVLFVAIIASEAGKAIIKETKIDILVTPIVTTLEMCIRDRDYTVQVHEDQIPDSVEVKRMI